MLARPGLAVAGTVLPNLPGSVRSIWSAAASGSATPLRLAVAQQQAMGGDVPLDGVVRIDLRVLRREPVPGGGPEAAAGEAGGGEPAPEESPRGPTPAARRRRRRTPPAAAGAAGAPPPPPPRPGGGAHDRPPRRRRPDRRRRPRAAPGPLLAPPPLPAAEVKIFLAQTQPAFLAGKLEGISVDPLGRLRLADRVERLAAVDEPFLLAAAAHPEGWVVGTGNAGKVLLVDRQGKVRELFAAPEPEIFAVLTDPDGTVFAASSPNGKVYRIPPAGKGDAEVFFDPGETYIWGLARAATTGATADGAAAGRHRHPGAALPGRRPGAGEVIYDGDDTHLRSLLALPGGDVVVGTAGEGLVQRLSPDPKAAGKTRVRTLYDADEPEVVALAAAPGGIVYAAVVASEASRLDLGGGAPGGEPGGKPPAAAPRGAAGAGAAAVPTRATPASR